MVAQDAHLDISQKLKSLREILRAYGSVLIAYSGGVDSALVAVVAHQELGGKSLACLAISPSLPRREQRDAIALLEGLGVPLRTIDTHEDADPRYAANASNRCFFCKTELLGSLRALADSEGWITVADGIHADDVQDHHHGIAAAGEWSVRHPLLEARMTKADVRDAARALGLGVWNKPAMACLSSRVPTGVAITPALLRQIESAEDVLAALGFRQFRVRHHGDVARIEVLPDDFPIALQHRRQLIEGIRQAGYKHVTLDLAGYRTDEAHLVSLSIRGV